MFRHLGTKDFKEMQRALMEYKMSSYLTEVALKGVRQFKKTVKTAFEEFEHSGRNMTLCATSSSLCNTTEIQIGLSIRNPIDTYDKQLGRTIAKGKAEKNPLAVIKLDDIIYASEYGLLKSFLKTWKSRIQKKLVYCDEEKRWKYELITR